MALYLAQRISIKRSLRILAADCEISYADVKLSVFSFQDDALRIVNSLESAQKGNLFMQSVMHRKQLSLNIDKCSILALDKRNRVSKVREAINEGKKVKNRKPNNSSKGKS